LIPDYISEYGRGDRTVFPYC